MPAYNKPKDMAYVEPLFGVVESKETSPKQYEFKAVAIEDIKDFIQRWHYSRNVNVSPEYCFALVSKRSGIVGAAIYSKPAMNSIYKLYGDSEDQILELRRLVCIDDTPKNCESYFVGKTLKWLIQNTTKKTVTTYADPNRGHTGYAYRACNFVFDGFAGDVVVLELPLEYCQHKGRCLAEGKKSCQVHDRNMRCQVHSRSLKRRVDDDPKKDYTDNAKLLQRLHKEGIAKLVKTDNKIRYHYHLEEKRTNKAQSCRMCEDLKKKPVEKFWKKEVPTVQLREKSDTFLPQGYILEDKYINDHLLDDTKL